MTDSFRTFEEAETYCNSFISPRNTKKIRTLRRIRRLMDLLGNPQKKLRVIHVTGSYGKSSTAYMIASILEQKGLTVGLHIKPHLEHITERMCINRIPISKKTFVSYVNQIRPVVATMEEQLTYFELLVAIMILYFSDNHVDVAVIEVGRGGKLDATHICHSDMVVITNIFLVHTDILGTTKKDILKEKLGLVSRHTKIVSGIQQASLKTYLQSLAKPFQSTVTFADPTLTNNISLPLQGTVQKNNAALALCAATTYTTLTKTDIAAALQSLKLPGRFEVHDINTNTIIMDSAHNKEKMKFLYTDLVTYYPHTKMTLFLKQNNTKEMTAFTRILKPVVDRVFLVSLHTQQNKTVQNAPCLSLEEAIAYINRCSQTTILITGSMELIGKIRTGLSIPYQLK